LELLSLTRAQSLALMLVSALLSSVLMLPPMPVWSLPSILAPRAAARCALPVVRDGLSSTMRSP
jgi:hypothetical protein